MIRWEIVTASVLLAVLVSVSGCTEEPDLMNAQRLTQIQCLAVLPFEDAPGMHGRNSGRVVAGFLTAEFTRSPKYRVIERTKLRSVMDEQDLQVTDIVDTETAVKVGRVLGVDGIVLGAVSQYDMDKTTVYIHVVPIVSREYKVGATIRLIDVESGEIIYAHSASGVSGDNFTHAGKQAARKLLAPLPKT